MLEDFSFKRAYFNILGWELAAPKGAGTGP